MSGYTYDQDGDLMSFSDAYAGDIHDPLSQRAYMWNNNNPYMYSDPSGYCVEDLCIGETIFAVAAIRAITVTLAGVAGAVVGAAIAERHNDGKGPDGAPRPQAGSAPSNHSPVTGGQPNTDVSYPNKGGDNGKIRSFGPDGEAVKDIDYGHDHGAGDPHAHDFKPSPNGPQRQPGRPLNPSDRAPAKLPPAGPVQ